MKILFYFLILLFLPSFIIRDKHAAQQTNILQQDSVTLYIYYKSDKKKTFYICRNEKIIFKAKTGVEKFEYDSLKIMLDSSDRKNTYLPLTAISRQDKQTEGIEFLIQNIPGYSYIFIAQDEFVKGQYIFKPYYFTHPVEKPTRR
jgi:hypothetical protein